MKKMIMRALACVFGCAVMSVFAEATVDEPVLTTRKSLDGKWCSLGTSITWYDSNVASSGGRFTKGYQTRVREQIHFDAFANMGVNGGVVASAVGAVIKADIYTIEHGINDWGHSTVPGTIDDYKNNTKNGTFAANYRQVIDKIRATNAEATIILCTPRKGYGFGSYLPATVDGQKEGGYYLADYVSLVRAIGETEGLPVCDFYATCGEQEELADLSIDVALHPNDAGYQKMANELVKTLMTVFPEMPDYVEPEPDPELERETIVWGEEVAQGYLFNEATGIGSMPVVVGGPTKANLSTLQVVAATMAGSYVGGGPLDAGACFGRYDAEKNTYTCQVQSLSQKDKALRVIGLEFSQNEAGEILAKALWAKYLLNATTNGIAIGDKNLETETADGTYGVAAVGSGGVCFISKIAIALNGATRTIDTIKAVEGPTHEVRPVRETVPYEGKKLLFKGVKLADIVGLKAQSCVTLGYTYSFSKNEISNIYAEKPDVPAKSIDCDGFYFVSREVFGDNTGKLTFQVQAKDPKHYVGELMGVMGVELEQVGEDIWGEVKWTKYCYNTATYGDNGETATNSNSNKYYLEDENEAENDGIVFKLSLRNLRVVVAGESTKTAHGFFYESAEGIGTTPVVVGGPIADNLSTMQVFCGTIAGTYVGGGPRVGPGCFGTYDEKNNTYTCEIQSVSQTDKALRSVQLVFSQNWKGEILAQMVLSAYKLNALTDGIKEGDLTLSEAANRNGTYTQVRCHVQDIKFGFNGATCETGFPTTYSKAVIENVAELKTVPMVKSVLFRNAKLKDVVGLKATSCVTLGFTYPFIKKTIDTIYTDVPTTEMTSYDYDGFYFVERETIGETFGKLTFQVQAKDNLRGNGGKLIGGIDVELEQVGEDIWGAVTGLHYGYSKGGNYGLDLRTYDSSYSRKYYYDYDDETIHDNIVFKLSLRDLTLLTADPNKKPGFMLRVR